MPFAARPLIASVSKAPLQLRILGVMALAMLWVYWPTFLELGQRWTSEAQYSHGYLVPLFSAYLLWLRRDMLPKGEFRPSWWGLPLLAAGLALRFGGVFVDFHWLEAVSLLPCLAAACLLVGGWQTLKWSWPALAFLLFMVPLPYSLEVGLSHPLQRIGTIISTFTLQTLGVAAYSEGNVIVMGDVRIGVVEACSGLSMLMIFFALSTAMTILIKRSPIERTIIFFSAIPIALAANIVRIIVTALIHKLIGPELADLVFHDLAGWLMMPLALGMLWIVLRLLAWILVARPTPTFVAPTLAWATPSLPGPQPGPRSSLAGGPKP